MRLSVAVVTYRPDFDLFARLLDSLSAACEPLLNAYPGADLQLVLVDNSCDADCARRLSTLLGERLDSRQLTWQLEIAKQNTGFANGHNQAFSLLGQSLDSKHFHLVLNPDVIVAPDCLLNATRHFEHSKDIALLAPVLQEAGGADYHLCKRYPSLLDLFLRGFAPGFLRKFFQQRLADYELRELDLARQHCDLGIASGCFMLMKAATFRQLHGFNPAYFLYFEDFDFSLRARQLGNICLFPDVRIAHFGGNAARKGLRHVLLFVRSAWRFFSTHGWRCW